MKAKDIFGIILRTIAVWIFIWGAWQLVAGFIYLPATIESFFGGNQPRIGSLAYFGYGLPGFLAGLLVLRFANAILWFTYRE